MTLLLVLVAFFFTAVMGIKMIAPFFTTPQDQLLFEVLDEDLKHTELLAQQRALHIQQLKEIDADFASEKLAEQDYVQLRRRHERELILNRRALDEVHGGKGWEQRVDALLRRRLNSSTRPEPQPDQSALAAPERAAAEPSACAACAHPLTAQDRFCSQCGAPALKAESAAQLAEGLSQDVVEPMTHASEARS